MGEIKQYRKKPVTIEAIQFTDESKNICFNFITCTRYADFNEAGEPVLVIQTQEGDMKVQLGDWVIKGTRGEFYPCKNGPFEDTFELVEES